MPMNIEAHQKITTAHLSRLGYSVLARNVRTRAGEIDVIVFDGATLVFVEVKTARRGAAATRRVRRRRNQDS